jgi:peptidyl-tRNA hydrolase
MSKFLLALYKAVRRTYFDSKKCNNFIPVTSVVHGYIVFEPSAYMNSSGASPRIFDKQLKVFTVSDRRSTAVNERSIMLVKNCKY